MDDKDQNVITRFLNKRQLILSIITVFISISYISILFNMQVIHGEEYKEKSSKKMLRNVEIVSKRGEITDRYGTVLATSKLSYDVEIFKIACDKEDLNKAVLKCVNILEKNGDKIKTSFPINEKKDGFNFETKEDELKWKKDVGMKEEYSFEDVLEAYTRRYSLEDYNNEDRLKIILVRYEAGIKGYSLFRSVTIAENISEKSWATIEENKSSLCGIETKSSLVRYYPEKELTSHITGYVSKINSEEYNDKKDKGYTLDSYIGKTGIEYTFESFLKGENGIKKCEIDTYGNISDEVVTKESIQGKNITLTLDYRLQKVAENSLTSIMKEIQTGSDRFLKHEDAKSRFCSCC